MLNILFVNHFPLDTASFYRHIGLGKELTKKGHKVTILMRSNPYYEYRSNFHSGVTKSQEYVKPREIEGVKIVYWREPFSFLSILNSFQVLKYSATADVIHLNRAYPFSAIPTFLANVLSRKPLVVDLEDWDGIGGWASMSRKKLLAKLTMTAFEETIPRKGDAIITVSKILYRRVINMGVPEDRVFYIPNGVDTNLFNPTIDGSNVRNYFNLSSDPVIVAIGVLYMHEFVNYEIMIKAMKIVVKEIPKAKLLLIGWGPAMKNVKELVEKLNLKDNVILVGERMGIIPRKDVPSYIAAADVAVHILHSHYMYYHACSPKTLSEFMAMGKTIIASDIGEVHEALKDRSGALVRGEEPKNYADAIIEILSNPKLCKKLGKTAREKAVRHYAFDVQVDKLEKVYEKAIKHHKGMKR